MISKFDVLIVFVIILISSTSMCNKHKEKNVMDRVCSFGGNAACRTYCFFTEGSLTGYCDANNDCICNSTLTTNNNDVITEVEIFIINK
ncbi:unnamed protein product [Rotaria sp. Silwood2]|nr:unnamed protein product [Rotaria sp. Silwood2]CAF2551500.1 unnamed protein product [Rotaria sp. Silwood2]CAF2959392.1 unnamed protein product [Rotaria sp. Silwood2]CAF3982178.1 unnamed protein product [Rotaria sp. Silwood2]CAF4080969.1 unnamed protein product [Rotaria sp. Silwood2]